MSKFSDIYRFFRDLATGSAAISAKGLQHTLETTMNDMLNNPVIETLYNYVVIVGVLLLVMYFLIDLLDKITHENFTLDIFFYSFVKLLFAYFIIKNGMYIFRGLNGIAQWTTDLIINKTIVDVQKDVIGVAMESVSDVEITDFLSLTRALLVGLGTGTSLITTLLFAIISNVLVCFVAYNRVVKVSYQLMLAPIALADMSGHGLTPNIKHFIVEIFKIFMQEPIIVLSMIFLPYVYQGYQAAGVIDGAVYAFLVSVLVCAKLINSSETFVSDLL